MNGNSKYINFIETKGNYEYNTKPKNNKYAHELNLIQSCLFFIPKQFTITTPNGAYKFNIDLLKDSCSTIKKLLLKDPKILQYHIDINDKENVMKKFEDLYQLKEVLFNISDYKIAREITEILGLTECPLYLKPETQNQISFTVPVKSTIKMSDSSLNIYLRNKKDDQFTIIANDKEYECNLLGIYSSRIIKEILENNPETKKYVYNFDEGEFDFTIIQNLFNFDTIEMTINNMDSLLKIAEDLQIDVIIPIINEFIESYQNSMQSIDDKIALIDFVDELFEWLYGIKELTVEKVSNNIIKSIWIHSEEDIQELISSILQVVRTRFLLHPYLVDLLITLDKSANDNNHLKILIPYFVKRLKLFLSKSMLYCAFMYKLIKKGIVSMDEIIDFICEDEPIKKLIENNYDMALICHLINIISWFYPEINERKSFSCQLKKNINKLRNYAESVMNLLDYIQSLSIDEYKKKRDFGSPNDDVTYAILNDDIETLQSLITKYKIDINEYTILPNLYQVFIYDKNKSQSLINYAAECGSLKCFKYLFLNHATLTEYSFSYAIFGGNTEIIRILDQNGYRKNSTVTDDYKVPVNYYNIKLYFVNNIYYIYAIITHRNDLFDWLLENDSNTDIGYNYIKYLFLFSALSGNMHSFISFVDKGFIDSIIKSKDISIIEDPLKVASYEGYYRYMQLLQSFYKKSDIIHKNNSLYYRDAPVNIGCLQIFKLNLSIGLIVNVKDNLIIAIKRDYDDIFYYIIDNLYRPVFQSDICDILHYLSLKKSAKFFNYFENKYNLNEIMISFGLNRYEFIRYLCNSCLSANVELIYKLTDFILTHFPEINFTEPFIIAIDLQLEEICKYFIDKKVILSISKIINYPGFIPFSNGKIALTLIDNIENLEMKNAFLRTALNISILGKNKGIAEYILGLIKPTFETLINAVKSHDLDILKLVLKFNNKSSFINQTDIHGSILNYAVYENDVNIVKHLLSLPNINPNLYDRNNVTPVMVAISRFNVEILNVFIDYFGDEIQKQMWQFNDGVKKILHRLSNNTSKKHKKRRGVCGYPREGRYRFNLKEKEWHEFLSNNHEKISNIIYRLIEIEGIDLNCHVKRYTLLSYACEANDVNLLKTLIDSNRVDINSQAPSTGNTPLMVAIKRKNIETAEILINNPLTDINHRNLKNQTALTIAVTKELEFIISLLLKHPKFDPEESRLDYSFYISRKDIAKTLYNVKSLNINYINTHPYIQESNSHDENDHTDEIVPNQYETILIHAVNQKQLELIDMIVNHPSFDPVKSQVKEAIFASVKNNSVDIFDYLIKLVNNDVNIYNQRNQSLLFFSIICDNREFLGKILNSATFDSQKSDILDAFMKSSYLNDTFDFHNFKKHKYIPNEAKLDIMDDLLDYDKNHSHLINFNELLPNGKSFFTAINCSVINIENLVHYYLNHGVDPNIPDSFGVYPLEYSIMMQSYQFTTALIDSNRIDMSIRLKRHNNQTYLHLAALQENIFNVIFDRNSIDINAKDDFGETPLMKSCFTHDLNTWISLFNDDRLDYKHRNNLGEDAFDILRKNYIPNNLYVTGFDREIVLKDGTPDEKVEYFAKMVNFIINNNYY